MLPYACLLNGALFHWQIFQHFTGSICNVPFSVGCLRLSHVRLHNKITHFNEKFKDAPYAISNCLSRKIFEQFAIPEIHRISFF
jgi:hypothetical protein